MLGRLSPFAAQDYLLYKKSCLFSRDASVAFRTLLATLFSGGSFFYLRVLPRRTFPSGPFDNGVPFISYALICFDGSFSHQVCKFELR